MEWKALLIIVKEVDAVLNGTTYKGLLTPTEIADAEKAITLFPSVISSITKGNATLVFPNKNILVNKLSNISYVNGSDVWPDANNIFNAIISQGDNWEWGIYDSVFVVHPLPGGGWGSFDPTSNRGSTYATINAKAGWMLTCNGEVFLHEWLHGACGFFRQMGYTMPKKLDTSVVPNVTRKDADCAGVLGYVKDGSGCWKPYYIALMTNSVVDLNSGNKPMGGVPIDDWKFGNLKNPQYFVGLSKTLTGFNKIAFKNEFNTYSGVPTSEVYKLASGFIQDFASKNGNYAILQGEGSNYSIAYLVKPEIWKKLNEHGGVKTLGYPINTQHNWGTGGYIQDFETSKKEWHAGIMQEKGKIDIYIVKGGLWQGYLHFGGATGELGYPTGDEFTWYSDKYKMDLYIQYFQNKRWVWVMSKSPWKTGTNKEYKQDVNETIFPEPNK